MSKSPNKKIQIPTSSNFYVNHWTIGSFKRDADRVQEIDYENRSLLHRIHRIQITKCSGYNVLNKSKVQNCNNNYLNFAPFKSIRKGYVDSYNPNAYRSVSKWRAHHNRMKTIEKENFKIHERLQNIKNINKLCCYYENLHNEKMDFLQNLAENYRGNVTEIRKKYAEAFRNPFENDQNELKFQNQLRTDLMPPYNWFFKQIVRYKPDGIKFLVDLRADLLECLRSEQRELTKICLRDMSKDLKDLLSVWFCGGMLTIQRISWNSSCQLMEKISEYEAVHPVRTWKDIKNRMGDDRRCYIYTHSSMPNEPLVILHVALRNEILSSTESLIKATTGHEHEHAHDSIIDRDTKLISTAIFYSITSTQPGLKQIELGNCLIRHAIRELRKEFPDLATFVTLSPIPQFRLWFLEQLKTKNCQLFSSTETKQFKRFFHVESDVEMFEKLKDFCDFDSNNVWCKNLQFSALIRDPLMRICAKYLMLEKKRGYAFNSVANFHLRNGAQIWRLNWMADQSVRGLNNSFGLMVNYNYNLKMIDANSQQYLEDKLINASDLIKNLLKSA